MKKSTLRREILNLLYREYDLTREYQPRLYADEIAKRLDTFVCLVTEVLDEDDYELNCIVSKYAPFSNWDRHEYCLTPEGYELMNEEGV